MYTSPLPLKYMTPYFFVQRHLMRIFKKNIFGIKTIHFPNKIRSHLVTIVPMAPFTPKSTSKLISAVLFRYSIVIPSFILRGNTAHT